MREFENHVGKSAFPVTPPLELERVVLDLVRRAVDDINSTLVGLPTCSASGRPEGIRVGHAPVVFVLKFVLRGSRSRVVPAPKLRDESLAIRGGRKRSKLGSVAIGKNVGHGSLQPVVHRCGLLGQYRPIAQQPRKYGGRDRHGYRATHQTALPKDFRISMGDGHDSLHSGLQV